MMENISGYHMMKILALYFGHRVESGLLILREIDQMSPEEIYRVAAFAVPEEYNDVMCISSNARESIKPSIEYVITRQIMIKDGTYKKAGTRLSQTKDLDKDEIVTNIFVRFWRKKGDRGDGGYTVRISKYGSVTTYIGDNKISTTYNQSQTAQYFLSIGISVPLLELSGKTPIQAGIAKRQK